MKQNIRSGFWIKNNSIYIVLEVIKVKTLKGEEYNRFERIRRMREDGSETHFGL